MSGPQSRYEFVHRPIRDGWFVPRLTWNNQPCTASKHLPAWSSSRSYDMTLTT